MSSILPFEGTVNRAGYKWVPDTRRENHYAPWVSKDDPKIALVNAGDFSPLDEANYDINHPTVDDAALFRNFARLEKTPDAILEFASKYGNLRYPAASFAEWKAEICTMQCLIELWDAAGEGRTEHLAKHFKSVGRGVFEHEYGHALLFYKGHSMLPDGIVKGAGLLSPISNVEGATITAAAQSVVLAAVNLRMTADEPFVGFVDSAVRGVPFPQNVQLGILPSSLIGSLWYQFADAISGQKQYRQCEACHRYMELAPEVNRADRRYCSDACRSKALRRRQKLSRQMRDSGKSLREIAKATGSDVATIKQWLSQKEK
jgi:hypothetical protein